MDLFSNAPGLFVHHLTVYRRHECREYYRDFCTTYTRVQIPYSMKSSLPALFRFSGIQLLQLILFGGDSGMLLKKLNKMT